MSLPKYLDNINDEMNKYLNACTLLKEEKNLLKLLQSLLKYIHWSIQKLLEEKSNSAKMNNIDAQISKIKSEILTFIGKNYTKQPFFILDPNCFDDSIEYISTLMNNFYYYFSNIEIDGRLLNIYFYLFHLIYYILLIVMKKFNQDIFQNEIIKFYLYHIIHFFANDKKCPEFNFFFYEGAFKHLYKNFNVPFKYTFTLGKDFLKIFNGFDVISIVSKYKNDKSNENTKITTELNFIGEFSKIINEINKLLYIQFEDDEKIYSGENFDNALLLKLCENYKKKIENVIKFLNKYSIEIESLENYKNKVISFIKDIQNYMLTLNHLTLMKLNYREFYFGDNLYELEKYSEYIEKWKMYNEKSNQDYTKIFRRIINSENFKTLYLIAMNSSYVTNFVNNQKLNVMYNEFMKKYADNIEKYVLYVPLTKGIKAYVANYFRIAVNINSVDIIGTLDNKEKEEIFKSYLLIHFLHESIHFIFRLNKIGKEAKETLSPKNKKLEEYYEEIGVDIILYIFGTEYIIFISPKNSNLINNINSWKKSNTNFKVFDKVYLSHGQLVNKGNNNSNETGLKCNISLDAFNTVNNDINYNFSDTMKLCF